VYSGTTRDKKKEIKLGKSIANSNTKTGEEVTCYERGNGLVHKVEEDYYYLVQTHTVIDLLLLHFIKMTIFMRTSNDAMVFLAINNMS